MKTGLWQLISHEHSGRVRHHRHTSYAGLIFMLIITGILLASISFTTSAAAPAVNPQSGSVGLTGTVRGPAPTQAATIASPRNGQHTSNIPLTVIGTCPVSTFVIVTKNNSFAGATDCQTDATFTLQVDLFDGQNTLIARVSDALGQYGPDSNGVLVFYDAPNNGGLTGAVGQQLFLQSSVTVESGSPGQSILRTITIVGGVAPYAFSWDWGDGNTSLSTQTLDGQVEGSHTYDRPGNYRVIAKVSDSTGNAAYMQLVTVVNGPVSTLGNTKSGISLDVAGALTAAWPLLTLASIMVLFFWLGERRASARLRREAEKASLPSAN
jgi:PKD repeat protein